MLTSPLLCLWSASAMRIWWFSFNERFVLEHFKIWTESINLAHSEVTGFCCNFYFLHNTNSEQCLCILVMGNSISTWDVCMFNTEACKPSAITKDRAVSSSFSSAIHPHLSPFVVYLGAYTRAPAESITCSSSVRESLLSVSKWIHAPQPLG